MLKTKQLFIWLWVIIFTGLLALGVYFSSKNKLLEIFEYIPDNTDQVMVNRVEKNMQSNQNMLVEIPQAVYQQFQQIKVMILVQDKNTTWDQLIFLQTKSEFSPQEFLKTINPEENITSTYLRLQDWLYLFGPQQIIQEYTQPSIENRLFYQPQLKKYIPEIKQHSLSIISHANQAIWLQKQVSSLLDSAKYLLINISSTKKKFDFSAYMIFSWTQQQVSKISFQPKFTQLLTESTIAYFELGNILSGTNISSQLASWALQDLLLKKLLANNLWIVMSKWSNMFNIWLTVLSSDTSLFTDLEPLIPTLWSFLQTFPMMSGAQITSVQQPGKIGYDILFPNIQKIWLYLEQENNSTKLSIGNPIIEGKRKKLSQYWKNTIAVLHVDMNQVLWIYKQFSNIGTNASILTNNQQSIVDQMKDKVLNAQILLEEDAISLQWTIK